MKNYTVIVRHLSTFASSSLQLRPGLSSSSSFAATAQAEKIENWKEILFYFGRSIKAGTHCRLPRVLRLMIVKTLGIITKDTQQQELPLTPCNLIVIRRLRDERGDDERSGITHELDMLKRLGQHSMSSSNGGHSPVLNLSKSGNEQANDEDDDDAPSERSELHSPNPSIRDDEDNLSDGHASDVDETVDKDDDDDGELVEILEIIETSLVSVSRCWMHLKFCSRLFFSCSCCFSDSIVTYYNNQKKKERYSVCKLILTFLNFLPSLTLCRSSMKSTGLFFSVSHSPLCAWPSLQPQPKNTKNPTTEKNFTNREN